MFTYSLRSVGSRTFPLSEHHSEAFGKPPYSVGSRTNDKSEHRCCRRFYKNSREGLSASDEVNTANLITP